MQLLLRKGDGFHGMDIGMCNAGDGMNWTDERVELLKKLWQDGFSASQIAGELGGVTRNAVIGKVHRLGLSGRGKPTVQVAARATKRASTPRTSTSYAARGNTALATQGYTQPTTQPRPFVLPEAEIVILAEKVTIMDLKEGMCKWPIGDPLHSDFRFCGSPCTPGLPYCQGHSCHAYHASPDRRRERQQRSRLN